MVAPSGSLTSSGRVYQAIMRDLELRRIVPGQRLIETELAARFAVGRNAIREAMQRLALRGVVDLKPNRSASIRKLNARETADVLEVAEAMLGVVARVAARNFAPAIHGDALDAAIAGLLASRKAHAPGVFSRARRNFYRALLAIGQNDEIGRLFPAISMHIIYSQLNSIDLQDLRVADYVEIGKAVRARDAARAEIAGRSHVGHIREAAELFFSGD